jgi:protein required for attachment to host cells
MDPDRERHPCPPAAKRSGLPAGGDRQLLPSGEPPKLRSAFSSELGDAPAGQEKADRSFGGSAYEFRSDAHKKEHLHFAHELADYLEQQAQQGRFHSLALYSSSPFLGELKSALGTAAARLLTATHDVDLTSVGLVELERRIVPGPAH